MSMEEMPKPFGRPSMVMSLAGLPSQSPAGGPVEHAGIHRTSSTVGPMRYSFEQKAEVHATLEAVLDRLDEIPRGPDPWEETCLVLALNFLESGLYDHASKELEACIRPAGARPAWREQQINRNPRRYSVARLRTRLDGVKAANRYGRVAP